MKKSAFFTFCFAFIPGAGQMYQGFMKRGLSLITLFCLAVVGCAILPYCAAALPIIWMYSFFDTFNIRANPAAHTDKLLFPAEYIDLFRRLLGRSPRLVGGCLIFLGIWMLFDNFVSPLLGSVAQALGPNVWYMYQDIIRGIPVLAVALIIIYVGFRLAFGARHTQNQEDYTEFKGGNDYDQND